MAKYQKYAEYKDSGVEWIGGIPKTWEVKPVFALFSPEMSKNLEGTETNVLSLSYGRIIQRDVENNHGLLPESFNTYQIVNYGDIILRLTDLQNDKRSLRVGLATQKGIITSAYLKLSALKEIEPRFAYRLLHSYDTTKVFYGMGGGLRQSMKFEDFRRLPILVPSKDEQTQIANFLDHETAKIDTLITKQEKLIELLKEKRQAVISHAVTKGLNPNVPMKDSGVEWLGEVPEHWDTLNLRWKINIASGEGISSNEIENAPELSKVIPVIGGNGVMGFTNKINTNSALAIGRVGALCGNVHLINYESWITDNALKISQWNDFDSSYLVFLIRSARLNDMANKSAQPLITGEQVKSLRVVIPPMEEQKCIVKKIEEMFNIFDHLIDRVESAIQLMQERRTALISAAVTGKIDVRNWQHPNQKNNNNTELSA
ncbi:restriction endonuclease subunit S [Acinetobacter radioresistens]|uniref:restriction endonuclease subunit S n=1 Tax=Acinetobacter radioresistens TaxID=40216 RepID=UPI002003D83B|nr:restriction endonuclease subunit S [Acinetobacter radioresistens]MCK4080185.1 restriction endonuclease subunit S [Acinetobacter radioresistens]